MSIIDAILRILKQSLIAQIEQPCKNVYEILIDRKRINSAQLKNLK